jgi:hypothetical protein
MSDFYIFLSEKGFTEKDIENLSKKEFDKFMDMFNTPFDKSFADFFRSIF